MSAEAPVCAPQRPADLGMVDDDDDDDDGPVTHFWKCYPATFVCRVFI